MPRENLHDKLFKQTFSVRSEAKAFVQLYLPKWISHNLDFRYFKRSSDSYINDQLKEYFSDMVYTCKWKGKEKIQISFLLEHKSYMPENILIQLLRYLVEAYEHQLLQKEPLTFIIPVVIYHGKQKWEKRSFDTYFNLPDERLKQYLPVFNYEFVDVMEITNELLKDTTVGYFLRSTFLLFKYKDDKEAVMRESKEIFIFVEKELTEEQKRSFIKSLLTYIFKVFRFEQEEFRQYTKKIGDMVDYIAGSLYDQAVKKGEQKGMEKGMEKGIEKGIEKGMVKGSKREKKLTSFYSFFKALIVFPKVNTFQLIEFTNLKKETIEQAKSIVDKKKFRTVKKEIYALFFKDITLTKSEIKEIDLLLKKYLTSRK